MIDISYSDKFNQAINSAIISTKVLDLAVLLGAHEAHQIVQRAMNNVINTYNKYVVRYGNNEIQAITPLVVDGILGEKSINEINHLQCSVNFLLEEINTEAEKVYQLIVEKNPSQKEFLAGRLNRLHTLDA